MLSDSVQLNLKWKDGTKEVSAVVELGESTIYIGRGRENDVIFADTSVSRKHARITQTPQGISIQDLNSRFGTYVDHIAIGPENSILIQSDVEIRLGNLAIKLEIVRPEKWLGRLTQEFSATNLPASIKELKQQTLNILNQQPTNNYSPEEQQQVIEQQKVIEKAFNKTEQLVTSWVEQNTVIHNIHLMLNQTPIYQDFLAQILPPIANVLKADRGFILKFDEQHRKLVPSATYHYQFDEETQALDNNDLYSQTVARRCYDENEIVLIEDTCNEISLNQAFSIHKFSIKSAVVIPLSYGERTLGVIYLDSQTKASCFNEEQKPFLQSLQIHLGTALKSAMHYSQAITDDLTGLYTRKFFEERIKQAMDQSRRYASTCCLILLDIDHFKNINDTYGHNCGDQVLREVANLLSMTARKSDVVGRLGGEEFIFLLTETNEEGALRYAERLRKDIANLEIQNDGIRVSVTASFGIVEYEASLGTMPYRFIEEADAAMYLAKRAGRDRVHVSTKKSLESLNTHIPDITLTD
ncbi:diguanylate cyclase [Aliikangiella coralliicola]|uniref:diguanylate cyclase n=1 Tax=Aliikangiella coralliicola TaxID=2592383 RepID=A0A545UJN6_9GAMM|nr:diguanylate cyclase [Aliikangiella coralliicola]TQV89684.1 diguanylate cyclase [Aliikangiella coralliicola]